MISRKPDFGYGCNKGGVPRQRRIEADANLHSAALAEVEIS
jgi:hypothetical protein